MLAAALWSSVYALLGCTDGIAEPIYSATGSAAQNAGGHGGTWHTSAGRGGSGLPPMAGSHSAAEGGDGRTDSGNGGVSKLQCDFTPPWPEANGTQEDALLEQLNTAIEHHMKCADLGAFTRMPFAMMDDTLHCDARQYAFLSANGAPWSHPPSGPGPSHDPFSPTSPTVRLPEPGSSPASTRMELLSDPTACEALVSSKYTRIGIGYYSSAWVITLAAE
jgi:hypothetical protein